MYHEPISQFQFKLYGLPATAGVIRLITLLPSADPSSTVKCVSHIATLKQNPKYEAISYAWGDTTSCTPIFLDDKIFYNTVSLYEALIHLRHDSRGKVRVLWADAICINQSDTKERNYQVQQMSSIYRLANDVVVWLGPRTGIGKKAFSFLSKHRDLTTPNGKFSQRDEDGILKVATDPQYIPGWKALCELLSHPWFQRAWIIQEIILTKKATIFFGVAKAEFNFMWNMCTGITSHISMLLYYTSLTNLRLREFLIELQPKLSRLGAIGLLQGEKKWHTPLELPSLRNIDLRRLEA